MSKCFDESLYSRYWSSYNIIIIKYCKADVNIITLLNKSGAQFYLGHLKIKKIELKTIFKSIDFTSLRIVLTDALKKHTFKRKRK